MTVPVWKPVYWLGDTLELTRLLPPAVRNRMGVALRLAQAGLKHPSARPLRGFGGGGVIEITCDHAGDTYREIYTIRF